MFFVPCKDIPKERMPTYARFVVDYRPQKSKKHRTCITVGGNLIEYPGDVHTPTAAIDSAKLLFNSM
eukprot:13764329-Ditylum_brightwellii.AAC.1